MRSLYFRLLRRYRPAGEDSRRREFLQFALAGSAGLLVSCASALRQHGQAEPNGRRIIVVGAGLAGLTCGYELISAGYTVTILEGRGRVGGRVLSIRDLVAGKVVEGGGEFIGSNHPTWLAYAKQFQLQFLDVTEEEDLQSPILLNGKLLTADESKALFEEIDAAYKGMTADAAGIDADDPWKSPGAAELDRKSTAHWLAGLRVSTRARLLLTAELTGNNGVALSRQSYLGNLAQIKGGGLEKYWEESEAYRCRGGNDQLATRLAEGIGAHNLRINSPVSRIQVGERGVTVTCRDGSTSHGDDAVLAVPPSVWSGIHITPQLPTELRPQMGSAVKYLAVVKDQFWRQDGFKPNAASDGMVSTTWEGTDNQPGPGVLFVAFSGGPPAENSRRRWAQHKDEVYKDELARIYSRFPDQLVSSRFMDWPGDSWTAGGYCFPAPGEVTTAGPILNRGLGRLHFAGEHTCYKFVGYMEGALNSGAALAKRLALRDGVAQALGVSEANAVCV